MKKITELIIENGRINIDLNKLSDIKDGKYTLTLETATDDRSLDQNDKLWSIINAICMYEDGDLRRKKETYMNILKMANVKSEAWLMPEVELDYIQRKLHIYCQVRKRVMQQNVPYVYVDIYYGTSTMNKAEMSRVIESAIRYANDIGVRL